MKVEPLNRLRFFSLNDFVFLVDSFVGCVLMRTLLWDLTSFTELDLFVVSVDPLHDLSLFPLALDAVLITVQL